MNRLLKRWLGKCFNRAIAPLRMISWRLWKHRNPDFLVILNYHEVTPTFDAGMSYPGCWTSEEVFEEHLAFLKENFTILSVPEAVERMNRLAIKGPCVALSFDDGHISVQEHAVRILTKHNVPATFFINTEAVATNRADWPRLVTAMKASRDPQVCARLPEDLNACAKELRLTLDPQRYHQLRQRIEENSDLFAGQRRMFVSREFLDKLDDRLFTLGLHGHRHQRFSMFDPDQQARLLDDNMRELSDYKAFRPLFAIPYGTPIDWDMHTLRLSIERGLTVLTANSDINQDRGFVYGRLPSDGPRLPLRLRKAQAGW